MRSLSDTLELRGATEPHIQRGSTWPTKLREGNMHNGTERARVARNNREQSKGKKSDDDEEEEDIEVGVDVEGRAARRAAAGQSRSEAQLEGRSHSAAHAREKQD